MLLWTCESFHQGGSNLPSAHSERANRKPWTYPRPQNGFAKTEKTAIRRWARSAKSDFVPARSKEVLKQARVMGTAVDEAVNTNRNRACALRDNRRRRRSLVAALAGQQPTAERVNVEMMEEQKRGGVKRERGGETFRSSTRRRALPSRPPPHPGRERRVEPRPHLV